MIPLSTLVVFCAIVVIAYVRVGLFVFDTTPGDVLALVRAAAHMLLEHWRDRKAKRARRVKLPRAIARERKT